MNERFEHLALSSFQLWLDHYLLKYGGAWSNQTGKFYNYSDEKLGNVFGSSYPQFVYDNSIVGANIITGAYLNSNFVGRGTSGLKIDYLNGRVFSNGNPTISGSFAVKDFNIYKTSDSVNALIDRAYSTTIQNVKKPLSYVEPHNFVVPFINLSFASKINKPFAFGGEDETKIVVRATILADDDFKIDGVIGQLTDAQYKCIPYINDNQKIPFTFYGDLKSGSFNYETDIIDTSEQSLYIDKVAGYRVSESVNSQGSLFRLGVVEFELLSYRFPRQ